jgi:GNAT superfamily N-acetyltransferase
MDIRPISPALTDDYFALFDNAFTDNPYWAGCYCAFYDDPRPDDEWDSSQSGFAVRNRENRETTIAAGNAHGLLAYQGGRPVGWVNAGPRDRYGNLRIFAEAIETDGPPTGAIMCFVIHPEYRGTGVASALLGGLDDYFRDLDLVVAEGYPRREAPADPDFPWSAAYYKGSPDMFRKAGYRPHREFERFVAVRKTL